MLLLSLEPTRDYPPSIHLKETQLARQYHDIVDAARSDFVLAFPGLAYSVFPYVVIGWLTIWEAAAHPSALTVTLIGVAIVLPFLIGYTVFAYRVFSGKAQAGLYGK